MSLPKLDAEQRQQALAKAQEARRVRAELKQMLKAGEVSIEDVLDRAQDAEPLAKMRVLELLESLPNFGKAKARRLMEELRIAESRRLRGLGERQREALLKELQG